MSGSVLTCPLCNTRFAPTLAPSPGERVSCPRCGDTFSWKPNPPETEATIAASSAKGDAAISIPPPSLFGTNTDTATRLPNWMVALLVLGVMSAMAGLGLIFMLSTTSTRRSHDAVKPPSYEVLSIPLVGRLVLSGYMLGLAFFILRGARGTDFIPFTRRASPGSAGLLRLSVAGALVLLAGTLPFMLRTRPAPRSPQDELVPVRAVPPAELAGLGYLPADVEAIAGVHVAEALATQSGQAMLDRMRLGHSELAVNTFAEWLGMKPDELDHIVVGLKAPLQVYIVIQTRKPYDQDRVTHFEKFDVRPHPEATSKLPLYECEIRTVGKITIKPTFWCAGQRTLLLFLNVPTEEIAHMQVPAPSGSEKLAEPLRSFLRGKRGPSAGDQLWFVARGESLSNPLIRFISPIEENALTKRIETFGAWAKLTNMKISLHSAVDCKDEHAARALAEKLEREMHVADVKREERHLSWQRETTAKKLDADLKGLPFLSDR